MDIPDLKEYKIYRNGSLVATLGKNVTSWVDCSVDAEGSSYTFFYKLKAKDDGNKLSPFSNKSAITGFWGVCGPFKITRQGSGNVPEGFSLNQNVPNPFNPETNISFDIPNISKVEIKVYFTYSRA